ncbi:hypothetical protein BGZ74_004145 [Mortierella antarctica]|nr:hypothetical protein BGZ74_004145 [Mortierella antarctica]
MEIFDIDMDFYSDSEVHDAREKMDDAVVESLIEALKEDDDSKVNLLITNIWEINFEGSTSQMVFNTELQMILLQKKVSTNENIATFLHDKVSTYTKTPVEESVVEDILENTLYSGKHINKRTRMNEISIHDLEEMVKNVMTACNLDHPWYKMWHFSRDVTRTYRPFNPTSYPGYFQARDAKDMFVVALNICNMQRSADSVCVLDDFTRRYEIQFLPLSELVDHKFIIKASTRNDKFITYDGATIKLRALTHYDIQILKYLIKHFDCDASKSIYQFLSSMMLSERDIRLAHDIGWFSGISWDVFAESRQKMFLLPDATCERDTYLAIENISKDYDNLLKGFVRDFKYQSSTSPANIWIAVTSLIFALVSVIQFFMGL